MRGIMLLVTTGTLLGRPRLGSHDGLMHPLLQLDGQLHGNTASAEAASSRVG